MGQVCTAELTVPSVRAWERVGERVHRKQAADFSCIKYGTASIGAWQRPPSILCLLIVSTGRLLPASRDRIGPDSAHALPNVHALAWPIWSKSTSAACNCCSRGKCIWLSSPVSRLFCLMMRTTSSRCAGWSGRQRSCASFAACATAQALVMPSSVHLLSLSSAVPGNRRIRPSTGPSPSCSGARSAAVASFSISPRPSRLPRQFIFGLDSSRQRFCAYETVASGPPWDRCVAD